MNPLKYLLSLYTLLLLFFGYSQNNGNLYVKSFKNTTLNLNDNIQFDSVFVKIINQTTREEKLVIFTTDINKRPLLEAGKYDLICSVKGEEDRIVEDIRVTGDMIAFVQLLYEPKQKLTCSQKRKRKKQVFIYESYR